MNMHLHWRQCIPQPAVRSAPRCCPEDGSGAQSAQLGVHCSHLNLLIRQSAHSGVTAVWAHFTEQCRVFKAKQPTVTQCKRQKPFLPLVSSSSLLWLRLLSASLSTFSHRPAASARIPDPLRSVLLCASPPAACLPACCLPACLCVCLQTGVQAQFIQWRRGDRCSLWCSAGS